MSGFFIRLRSLPHFLIDGEFYQKVDIVGLDFRGVSGLIADGRAAFIAFIDDDISLFRVGENLNGAEDSAAVVGAVAGVYIYMNRTKASGAVVAGSDAEGFDLKSTVFADKAVIVFLKAFFFHKIPLFFVNESFRAGAGY